MSDVPVIRLLTIYETDDPNNHQFLFGVRKGSGEQAKILVPTALRHDIPRIRSLFNGADVALPANSKKASALIEATTTEEPELGWKRLTDKTGWLDDEYILSHKTYPYRSKATQHRDAVCAVAKNPRSGSFKAWKDGIQEICHASSYATFAIGLALVGPLLKFLPQATGVAFNFSGESGTGKTSVMQLAQSVIGPPNDLHGTDITLTALEEKAARANDGFLPLDDFGGADSAPQGKDKLIKAMSYKVRDGRARTRSAHYEQTTGQNADKWRVAVLTNSEVPLAQLTHTKRNQGEVIRFIDIFVPGRVEGGVLEIASSNASEQERTDPKELFNHLSVAIEKNYGKCFGFFMQRFTEDIEGNAEYAKKRCAAFVNLVQSSSKFAPTQRRYAEAFGKIYAALVLAAKFKMVPFTKEHAQRCVVNLYRKSELQHAKPPVVDQYLGTLIDLIDDETLCPKLRKGEEPGRVGVWAFRRQFSYGNRIYLSPEGLARHLKSKEDLKLLEKIFLKAGIQIKATDGSPRQQVSAPWLNRNICRPRLIVLDERKLRRLAVDQVE